MSRAWTWYIVARVAINVVGCTFLLWWTSRRRPGDPAPEDTSHIWDGDLTEYNKPLPRWWIVLFYLTIAFAVGYIFWFGGLGGIAGSSGWTSNKEHAQDVAENAKQLEATFRPYDGQPIDQLAQNPKVLALGRQIFVNTCATCHGSSGQGAIGYPNLADTIWKWGGDPDTILTTVLHGREAFMGVDVDADTKTVKTGWGPTLVSMGGPDAVNQVASYVLTLSNPSLLSNDALAQKGKVLFDGVCVACHGADGKGNQALGAPDLTDNDWLYGGSKQAIMQTIDKGHYGVMPARGGAALSDTQVRVVAAYVWSLSHPTAKAAQGQ
jgi:cytochrome c oxidase cbb3-type subunit 3